MTLSTVRSTFLLIASTLLLLVAFGLFSQVSAETQIQHDPVTIVNEAELKGEGVVILQPYEMSSAEIEALKAAPFSIINEALLKGDGIYTER